MSYRVVFTEAADADINSIIEFIALDSPIRAYRFVDELISRIIDLLGQFPLSGTFYHDVRFMMFDNYTVVYDVDESNQTVYVYLITERHREWKAVLSGRRE
ncbi:MAG: type II toxin-antitoxin system RelE/ParE family toxin [Chromatiales bacterium]|nr:type II toxin-antitoxin system RelE/ParE family toxin [Gammaproteobacteria bacterium]